LRASIEAKDSNTAVGEDPLSIGRANSFKFSKIAHIAPSLSANRWGLLKIAHSLLNTEFPGLHFIRRLRLAWYLLLLTAKTKPLLEPEPSFPI